jgi:hypothetical protein
MIFKKQLLFFLNCLFCQRSSLKVWVLVFRGETRAQRCESGPKFLGE